MLTYCWNCLETFESDVAEWCARCTTFTCPSCGTCFCKLTPEAQRAVSAAMYTYGHWKPGQNPRKKRTGLADDLAAAFIARGIVKNREEFLARYKELYEKYPEIVAEVLKARR
jgi:hypothetical protein